MENQIKIINSGKGLYGYSYILTIEIKGKGFKEERHNFWFQSYTRRDDAMQLARQTIPNAKNWRKIGK